VSIADASLAAEWTAAWQPVVDLVGTDFGDGVALRGPDAVEAGSVRRFCEPLELDCPLHHDADIARARGYADVVAPVSSLVSYTIQPLWSPGENTVFVDADAHAQPARTPVGPRSTGREPPSPAYFATEMEAQYLQPVVVGDRLTRVGNRLVSCVPKQTHLGRGAFMTWESEIRNQHDRVVARVRNQHYRYKPDVSEARRANPADPAPRTIPENRRADWSRQRAWHDVDEGEELDSVAFPLTIYRLVVAAGANRDFNAIHHNREWARSTGAPDMYANSVFLLGMWERCVREFIGLAGSICEVSGFRMRSFNTVGDTVVVRGRVEKKWLESSAGYVALAVWSENSQGVSVGPGTITVTLPAS
jgi:acyl dehydratase